MKTRMTWMAGLAALALTMVLTAQTASAGERDRHDGGFTSSRGHDTSSSWRGGSSWDRDRGFGDRDRGFTSRDRGFGGSVYFTPTRYVAPTRYYTTSSRYYAEPTRRVVYVTPTAYSRSYSSSGISIRIILGD